MQRVLMTSSMAFAAAMLLAAPAIAQTPRTADPTTLGSPTSASNNHPTGPVQPTAGTSDPMAGAPTSDLSADPPDPTTTGAITAPATHPTDVMATGAAVTAADTSNADRDPVSRDDDEDHGRWGLAGLLGLLGLLGIKRREPRYDATIERTTPRR